VCQIKRHPFIRLATKDDYSFIRQLSREVFSVFGKYDEIIPQWFLNPDVITIIYVKNGHPMGFAMLYLFSGEILAIAVNPKYQRKGIGSALLIHLETIAKQLGLGRLLLHTAKDNIVARLFFQKLGFKVIGRKENYYPKGQSAFMMSKPL